MTDSEKINEIADMAESYFRKGYNCSQSVFVSFAHQYGIDEKTALKISASFGGGMGRMREVCGCMSAMALVAGLESGCTTDYNPKGKEKNYEMVQHLAKEFKKISGGSIVCRELLGLDKNMKELNENEKQATLDNISESMTSPIPSERTQEYYKKRPCIQLIRAACEILERQIGREKIEN